MKLIALLFAILIASSIGGIVRVKKNGGRTASPEAVDFQILYLGTCDQFYSIQNIRVTRHTDACLPISNTSPYNANDDLHADVLCTNIGRGRAQIDFVEVFETSEATPYPGAYAISFVPNRPLRAINGASYVRRPSCTIQKDFCSTTNYVHSCNENAVVLKNGFVVSNDEIFIIPQPDAAVGCGQAINSCCTYINNAFCPRSAPQGLLSFNWEHNDYNSYGGHNNHQDDHHDNHNDNSYGNDHHGNQHGNQHDNDDYEDDDEQHGPHHGGPSHGGPQYGGSNQGGSNHGGPQHEEPQYGGSNQGGSNHGGPSHGGHHGKEEEAKPDQQNAKTTLQFDEDDKKKK